MFSHLSFLVFFGLATAVTATFDPAHSSTFGQGPANVQALRPTGIRKHIQMAECSHNTATHLPQQWALFITNHAHDKNHGAPYGDCLHFDTEPLELPIRNPDYAAFFWDGVTNRTGSEAENKKRLRARQEKVAELDTDYEEKRLKAARIDLNDPSINPKNIFGNYSSTEHYIYHYMVMNDRLNRGMPEDNLGRPVKGKSGKSGGTNPDKPGKKNPGKSGGGDRGKSGEGNDHDSDKGNSDNSDDQNDDEDCDDGEGEGNGHGSGEDGGKGGKKGEGYGSGGYGSGGKKGDEGGKGDKKGGKKGEGYGSGGYGSGGKKGDEGGKGSGSGGDNGKGMRGEELGPRTGCIRSPTTNICGCENSNGHFVPNTFTCR